MTLESLEDLKESRLGGFRYPPCHAKVQCMLTSGNEAILGFPVRPSGIQDGVSEYSRVSSLAAYCKPPLNLVARAVRSFSQLSNDVHAALQIPNLQISFSLDVIPHLW